MDRSPVARRTFLRSAAGATSAVTGLALAGRASAQDDGNDTTTTATPTATPGGYGPLGRFPVEGAKEAVVGPDGTTVYLATTDGFAVADVSDPANPELLVEPRPVLADHEDGPLPQVYDVKVEGDRLLVAGPANPGQGDLRAAVLFDVSDPADPQRVGFLETEFFHHNVFLRDGLAYLGGNGVDGHPLVVADVEAGEELGRWSITSAEPGWEDLSGSLWTLHDLWVQDGVAYLAHWDAGTWMVDVSDPASPELIAKVRGRSPDTFADLSQNAAQAETVQPPGNDHYVTVNDDASVLGVGVESWDLDPGDDTGGPGGIHLYDVSDPSSPEELSVVQPPPTDDPTFGGTWVTSHNFELVGDRLYSSWYAGGVRVFDVSDPANPELTVAWRDSAATSFWTSQAARPGDFFVATSRRDPGGSPRNAALYTFPDTADGGGSSPTQGTTGGTTAGDGTTTGGSDGSGGSGGTGSGDATTTDGSSGASGPGFGVGATVTALGLAAWRARRRTREE